jgi:flagellar hook-associated protein 3 FlgL
MRISTNTMFEMGSGRIGDLSSGLVKIQQQLSTQRRVLTPSDDPIASAQALVVTQSLGMAEQYATNRLYAKNGLSEEESALASITTVLQDAKTLVVNAGNAALSDADRKSLAVELSARIEDLLGLANAKDGGGNYMFGGYQTSAPPFTATDGGALYSGDQGQRMLQIGPSRQIAMSDSGNMVFEGSRTGNGRFATAASGANAGTGIITGGNLADITQLTGHDYQLTFHVDAVTGATTYEVADASHPSEPAPVPPPGAAYASGQAIAFKGMRFEISGQPADGDVFTVKPSENQSVFTTLKDLLATLNAPATGAAGRARLTNDLGAANTNIDNALDNVLSVRASVGSRLKEIDALDSSGDDMKLRYTETLSSLQDIDLAESISAFTQQQTILQAAQKSFVTVSGLSLFDLLG